MKGIVREFLKRGMLFAWGGPAVVAFVWLCLNRSGELAALSVGEAVLGIYSSTALAFVAAGITVVYQMEQLPKPIAGLIHMAVLYADYLVVYLLNGWIKPQVVAVFSLVFVLGFGTIWGAVYLTARRNVSRMNRCVQKSQ
ncbi:MAG: DUF3021 domain-containing protein [Candidatus Faecousia sp.]|nr:DUF3021 domain-containing protein [Candidatus Faecousia sp.]